MANLQQYWNRAAAGAGTRSKPFRVWGRALAYLLTFSLASGAATGPLDAQGIKISALPAASSANAGDELPANQSGTTRKLTTAQIVALLSGGSGIGIASNVISTASNEADFLISGALTCGAATQGKVQTHSTTPLQYCDNAATPTLRYAAYGNAAGECLNAADGSVNAVDIVSIPNLTGDVTSVGLATTITANSVALGPDTTGGYAASVSEAGPATTASAAVSDPANCSVGSVAGGVDASWIGQDCLDPITETELDTLAELNTQLTTTIADGPHTVDTDDQTAAEVVYTPIDATDWTDPDPDDVADGLDKVVDRLKAEEGKADDDVPELGDFGALALTGPVTSSGVATSIANDAITEPMLKSVNAPTDELCLSYELTTGDFEWQACGGAVNSFETIAVTAGTNPVADSSTDTLSIACGGAVVCTGSAAGDSVSFGVNSVATGFLTDFDTTDLTCGEDTSGRVVVLNSGKLQYCDGNDTAILRSGFLDADGTDDDLPDADEIVESMLKAVDAAVDEECLTFETTTGDFEWQSCAAGGSGDVVGPASATDECFARFDSTTGKLIQNSIVCATDAGIVTGATQYNVDNLRLDGNTLSSTDTNGPLVLAPNGAGFIGLWGSTSSFPGFKRRPTGNQLELANGDGAGRGLLWLEAAYFNATPSNYSGNGTVVRPTSIGFSSAGVIGWTSGTDGDQTKDIGLDRSAANELNINAGTAGGTGKLKKLVLGVETLTIADNGGGTKATSTLTPTKSLVECTCNDADGCTVTMGETGMVSGWDLTIVNVGTNTCEFADTAGVSELSAAFVAGQYDTLKLMYTTSTWVEVSRSDN